MTKRNSSEKADCFKSEARRKRQAEKDAAELARPAYGPSSRTVYNLRSIFGPPPPTRPAVKLPQDRRSRRARAAR